MTVHLQDVKIPQNMKLFNLDVSNQKSVSSKNMFPSNSSWMFY